MLSHVKKWNIFISLYFSICAAVRLLDSWPVIYAALFWTLLLSTIIPAVAKYFVSWLFKEEFNSTSVKEKAEWGVQAGMSFAATAVPLLLLGRISPYVFCIWYGAGTLLSIYASVAGSRFYGNTPAFVVSSVLRHIPVLGLFIRRLNF